MILEQMTADNIEIDCELFIESDHINAYLAAWLNVDARFGTQTYGTDSCVNVYANYFPEGERLEVGYTVFAADGSGGDFVEVEISDSEREVLLTKLREVGLDECVAEVRSGFEDEFECVELFGDDALFTNGRVPRNSLPEGLYAYDLRHDDCGELCTVARHVAVNHSGVRWLGDGNAMNLTTTGEQYMPNYKLGGREARERLAERYPVGTRIELHSMCNDEPGMPSGLLGTVIGHDDQPSLRMAWDNGRSLSLFPDEDSFAVIPQSELAEEMQDESQTLGGMSMSM